MDIEISDRGSKRYYCEGQLHREDGPAVERFDGTNIWYYHGKIHRDNGPAIVWYDGDCDWYYNGKFVDCSSQEEFDMFVRFRAFI
jgi:hypothetical protein